MERNVEYQIINSACNLIASRQGYRGERLPPPVIPEIKKITEYVSALDRAICKFFNTGDSKDIFLVLKDARENDMLPKAYRSIAVKKVEPYVRARKATLAYTNGKVKINIFFTFDKIVITSNKVIISGKPKITTELGMIINESQEMIEKIERILKKTK